MMVNIDDDYAIDALIDRVKFWTDDDDVIALFTDYYTHMAEANAYSDFNVKEIVDNDYINLTNVYTKEEIEENFPHGFEEDRMLAQHDDYYLYYVA